jgi:cell division cycle 14
MAGVRGGETVEVIPGRVYLSVVQRVPPANPSCFYFSVDTELLYEPFFADFGPLHLGHTYRFLHILETHLRNPRLADKRIVQYCSTDPAKRANACVLLACFLLISEGKTPEEAWRPFQDAQLLLYRDATMGACPFGLTGFDCVRGLHTATKLGWFWYQSFDVDSYEYYSRVENGDMNWIVPSKFLAFACPAAQTVDMDGWPVFTPEKYAPIFIARKIGMVIRLNKKSYDRARFTNLGLKHFDLYFIDGSCPAPEIVRKFLEIVEPEPSGVAIHCKAGLGRTGTLIGLWCMKHTPFQARPFIGWARLCRPGSILGPQQQYLCEMEREYKRSNVESLTLSAAALSLNDDETEADRKNGSHSPVGIHGDLGQGERLVNAKRGPRSPGGTLY